MINICPLPLFDHIYELKCYNLVQERQGQKQKLTLTLSLSLSLSLSLYARMRNNNYTNLH